MEIGRLDHHIRLEGQPVTKPKYGVYDGFAARFTSDRGVEIWVYFDRHGWCKPNRPYQVWGYETAVLTEEKYHRMFGDLPPLPDHAFRSGWRSPLV